MAGGLPEFLKAASFIHLHLPSKFFIDVHTDSEGDVRSNKELSLKRARAIEMILEEDYEFITPSMVEARGYGAERPIASNDTPENRALNRRIEVVVEWK